MGFLFLWKKGDGHVMNNKVTRPKWQKRGCMLACFLILAAMPMTVLASSNEITSKINSLTDLLINIFAAVGVAILAFGFFEFASALQAHDPSQQMTGLKRIIAGLMVISIKLVVDMLK